MEKFSFVNKELYLLGDFNIDLLKTDDDANIDEFYNIISSNFIVPHITLPTRITSTLIDNIFTNNLNFVHAVLEISLCLSLITYLFGGIKG